LATPIGQQCRATLRIATDAAVCFRYDRSEHRFTVRLHTDGLESGSVVRVVVEVRAADGTVASSRSVSVRVL
jgi:hypothetical protein